MDAGTIAALIGIAVALSTALSVLSGHLASRRSASGRIRTSEADVLWQQAQEMRVMLQSEKTRAEEQRDRLITSYTEQILPALASLGTLVQELTAVVDSNRAVLLAISAALQEGGASEVGVAVVTPPPRRASRQGRS